MLIDDFMPDYEVVERHDRTVRASAEQVYRAVQAMDLARAPLIKLLFAVRGLRSFTMEQLVQGGFVLLGEEPGVEIVLGVIGKFWRPGGGIRRVSAADFATFAEPGFAKGAWNFRVVARPDGTTMVTTETRVTTTDAAARRQFRRYWRFIGPFSALTRRAMLRLVQHDAERLHHSEPA